MTVTQTPAGPPGNTGGDADDGSGDRPGAPRAWRLVRLRTVVVGLVLVGALVFLLVEGLGGSLNYYVPVDQAVHQKATLGTRQIRLEGVVVPGSVHDTSHGVDFRVERNGVSAPVVDTGNPPQLFQPNIPVVVVGHFAGATFRSDEIIVKHTSQYIAAHPNRVRAPNGTTR